MNTYLTEMTHIIQEQGGIIDKFQGDAIMAEFGIPLQNHNHADQAVTSGLNMLSRLAELRIKWHEKGVPELQCRIGRNTGRMIVGNLGSSTVMDYTVIGDAVNMASRLEEANKLYGTSLIVSHATHQQLTPNRYKNRIIDVIRLRGKKKSVRIYEVYAHNNRGKKAQDTDLDDFCAAYEKAFYAYLEKKIDQARDHLQQSLALRPDDPSAVGLLIRVDKLDSDIVFRKIGMAPFNYNQSDGGTFIPVSQITFIMSIIYLPLMLRV